MASLTQWAWVWATLRRWWTGKPGVLQSMGSQRFRHDWVTEQQNNTLLTLTKLYFIEIIYLSSCCEMKIPWAQILTQFSWPQTSSPRVWHIVSAQYLSGAVLYRIRPDRRKRALKGILSRFHTLRKTKWTGPTLMLDHPKTSLSLSLSLSLCVCVCVCVCV